VTPEVATAVGEIKAAFPEATVEVKEEGDSVVVLLDPIELGGPYAQAETWIGFRITFQYPYSDVYPHFVRADLSRTDGAALGEGMGIAPFDNRQAVQISRRSNRLDPATDTALIKLQKVLEWLRTR
jgi:hypothetical protein